MPENREFIAKNGRKITLNTPPAANRESIYVVAGHKTGSVLLNNIINDLAKSAGVPAIAVESEIWREGFSIGDWPDEVFDFLSGRGYIYFSFRWLQRLPEINGFKSCKKIFMIRDPRDIAVSYYYSMARSHGLPKKGTSRLLMTDLREDANRMGIDEFIQTGKAGPILRNIQKFSDYLDDEFSTFYKYEDVIFRKREWVHQIASDINCNVSTAVINEIADLYDVIPEKEAPDKHIRRVVPGGYIEKLSSESVHYIRENYPVFFEEFGYE